MATNAKGTCVKLTDQQMQTYGGTQWVLGKWNPRGILDGERGLCSGGFYHAYDTDTPEVALLLNPIHANIAAPRLFVAEWRGRREDDGAMKCGATEMRVVREIHITPPTLNQRVAFAVLVALRAAGMVPWADTHRFPQWQEWAEAWLAGDGRTKSAAYDAANAANAAYAAYDAANAAYAAYDAANAASAASAAYAAAYATNAAYDAAYAAANATNAAYSAAYAANAAYDAADAAYARVMLAECAAWAIAFEDA